MRYALAIEYDGSSFFGWQKQRQSPTVQEVLEHALSKVANEPCQVTVAGRTDTGVHACSQIAHFDTCAQRDQRSWVLGLNSNLPESAAVLWLTQVQDEFHARFSALSRRYQYRICNRWIRPVLMRKHSAWCHRPLNDQAMHQAAQLLLGEHDFSSFRASGCQAKSPIRTISAVSVIRQGEWVTVDITANAFLYHMVRNIVGSLMEVGQGERDVEWFKQVLAARDRTCAGMTAAPQGLYFISAQYPQKFGLQKLTEDALNTAGVEVPRSKKMET